MIGFRLELVIEAVCSRIPITAAPTTSPAPDLCTPVNNGVSEVRLKFVSYENLGDIKMDCSRCDSNTSPSQQNYCDIVLEICVSPLGKR